MNKNSRSPELLLITSKVRMGERIYPNNKKIPVAVAEEDFYADDIGEFDDSVMYPVYHKTNFLLLPGLKKRGKKCHKHKKSV